jgi:hypothetical protein
MSKFSTLRRNWADVDWWTSVAIPFLVEQTKRFPLDAYGRVYYAAQNVDFIDVYEDDWDNLIVLDACRYDVFEEEYDGPGDLSLRYSRTPDSPSFFRRQLAGKECHDIVSVTANPHHKKNLDDDQFHDVYHVWETRWDDEIRNVHPEAMRDVALEADDSHPNKRLMIHFMQPHAPFIGPWGREHVGIHVGNEHSRQGAMQGYYDVDTTNPYSLAREGEIDHETLERAYRENLQIALEYVEDLLSELEGRTVVTADHGELFGERAWPYPWRKFQHPRLLAEKLLQVPWLVSESGDRKSIESTPPEEGARSDVDDAIEDKLRHLGYK